MHNLITLLAWAPVVALTIAGTYFILRDETNLFKKRPAKWSVALDKGVSVYKTYVKIQNNQVAIDLAESKLKALKLKGRNHA